jgi:hypothetical protein
MPTDILADFTESRVLSVEEMQQAIHWYHTTCPLSQASHSHHVVNEYECERHLENIRLGRARSTPKSQVGSQWLRATRLMLCLRLVESERLLFKLTWG